jgi:hypothetical protein
MEQTQKGYFVRCFKNVPGSCPVQERSCCSLRVESHNSHPRICNMLFFDSKQRHLVYHEDSRSKYMNISITNVT